MTPPTDRYNSYQVACPDMATYPVSVAHLCDTLRFFPMYSKLPLITRVDVVRAYTLHRF
jgi:hypothetical protein